MFENYKGLSIKYVRIQGGYPLRTMGEGALPMWTPHFWRKKIGFFEIDGVSARGQ